MAKIYLIPGSMDLYKAYKQMIKSLNDLNMEIIVAPIGLATGRIEKTAEKVKKDIISNNYDNIIIVSVSLGSVIAKYLIDNYQEINKRVKKVISICSPFKGTYLAIPLFFIPSYRQIIPNSFFLKKLNSKNKNNNKIVSIRPKFDTEVIPLSSEILEGAKNIQSSNIGHIFAPYRKGTVEIVKKEISSYK